MVHRSLAELHFSVSHTDDLVKPEVIEDGQNDQIEHDESGTEVHSLPRES